MTWPIPLVVAVLVAALVARLAYWRWPLPEPDPAERLADARATSVAPHLPFGRAVLAAFGPLVAYTPAGWARTLQTQLYWAGLAGRWNGWALREVTALHLALALAGAALGFLLAPGDVVLNLAAGFALPFALNLLALRAPARRVRRALAAELPEFVSLLAAEIGLGASLGEAVARLSRSGGACAAWFRRAQAGGPLFTVVGGKPGALLAEARNSGDPDLIGLALNLDLLVRRGTGTRELLSQTARAAAARYIGEAHLRAERVGGEIVLPMVAFFFLPYVVIILLVMAGPLLAGGVFR